MAQVTYTSFTGLTAAEFETHANAVLQSHVSSTERKQVMAYLSQVLASDAQVIDAEVTTAVRKRRVRRKQEKALRAIHKAHPYDYLKTPVPFTQSNLTDAQIAALLTNDDVDVSIGTRTLTTDISGAGLDAATSFLNITGDRVSLRGTGVTGSALDGSLQCTCVINGQIQIGGSDVVLEGIRFISHLPASIAFNATCANLTIRNCIFESRALYRHADNIGGSVFLYGGDDFAGGQFSGNFTLENCLIGGGGAHSFGSWMLADLTSGSSQPPPASLRHVVIRNNKFVDCAGSFTCRSKADDPALSFTATGNRFEYQPTGDYAQHPLFWSALEVNNCLKVVATGNVTTNASKTSGGTRGFLQCWSRSPHAWSLTFTGNTINEFNIALQLACSATFYAPQILDADHAVSSKDGEISAVDLAASFVYPWLTGTYAPENQSAIAAVTTSFEAGLSTFPV